MEQENVFKLDIVLEWIRYVLYYILQYFFSASEYQNPAIYFCYFNTKGGSINRTFLMTTYFKQRISYNFSTGIISTQNKFVTCILVQWI